MHAFFSHACNACIAPLGLVAPPKEFSDLDYVMGTAGADVPPDRRRRRRRSGGRAASRRAGARLPRRRRLRRHGAPARRTRRAAAAGGRRRRRIRRDRAGLVDRQAAVRPDRRHQSRQGRADVVHAARRHAGRGAQSPGAEGREHPEDRPAGQRRRGRDEDARHRRRPAA